MPKQVQKGGLFAKLGDAGRGAHDNNATAETTYDNFGDLPPGINNGIAKLVECKFTQIAEGKKNAGEYMFYAAGVVVEPEEHEGIPVRGLRTQISEILCNTPDRSRKTVAEHLGWVYNELRKLGLDTANMQYEDLEANVAALKEVGPYFRFRTWQGEATEQFPNPRVNHNWNGIKGLEDYVPPEDGDGVTDNTAQAAPPAPAKPPVTKPGPKAPAKPGKPAAPPAPEPEAAEPTLEELAVLAADTDDLETAEAAQAKLSEAAAAVGITEDQIANAESWDAVVEMINAGGAGTEEGSSESNGEYVPQEGDMLSYQVRDAKGHVLNDLKTKKPRKPVQVSVVAVGDGVCDVKSMVDNKTVYKGVKFEYLDQIT